MVSARQPAVRLLAVLALVSIASAGVWIKLGTPRTGIDDANIFFVYADSISAGNGFAFNAGGERVEGFTSLLWVVICAAVLGVTPAPERLLLLLNVALLSATVALSLRTCAVASASQRRQPSPGWGAALVVCLLADPAFVTWHTVALMETALWGTLLTAAALLVVQEDAGRTPVLLALVVALLVLTRPEALAWSPIFIVLFYVTRAHRGHGMAFRAAAPALVSFLVTAGALTLFRVSYFGYALPNTFYAKVSPSVSYTVQEGAKYLVSYLGSGALPFASAVAAALSIVHIVLTRFSDVRTLAVAPLAAAALAMPVLTGGDHFDGFRFYQAVYPILVLTLLHCARFVVPHYLPVRLLNHRSFHLVAASLGAGALVTVQSVQWMSATRSSLLGVEFEFAESGRELGGRGNMLFSGLAPRPSIATITVGGLGYVYDGVVVDLMGLNDTRMAHNGGDRLGLRSHAAFERRTFDDLRPDVVIPLVQFSGSIQAVRRRSLFVDAALKGLLDDPDFRRTYSLAEVSRTDATGVVRLPGWYRRDFLGQLAASKDLRIAALPEPD